MGKQTADEGENTLASTSHKPSQSMNTTPADTFRHCSYHDCLRVLRRLVRQRQHLQARPWHDVNSHSMVISSCTVCIVLRRIHAIALCCIAIRSTNLPLPPPPPSPSRMRGVWKEFYGVHYTHGSVLRYSFHSILFRLVLSRYNNIQGIIPLVTARRRDGRPSGEDNGAGSSAAGVSNSSRPAVRESGGFSTPCGVAAVQQQSGDDSRPA